MKKIFLWSLLITLIFTACTEGATNSWTATYCNIKSCPSHASTVKESGYLHEGDDLLCPDTIEVETGTIQVQGITLPVIKKYYLKEDSCKMEAIK